MNELFRKAARKASTVLGSPWAFISAFAVVVLWAVSGPIFHYSQTWQLIINTGTTIITFLMVFLIQNTQNHDSRALHLKIDELLVAVQEARSGLVDLDELSEAELDKLESAFRKVGREETQAKKPAGTKKAAAKGRK
ncbi:MAG TPA: low affinity iron permease family protein [Thermoanaerobaculia bacterium]|jgi:low affinity Fe/Cu permease|nr:low affinity iron permease family protein [Thermoanaerobaculia bacterium]